MLQIIIPAVEQWDEVNQEFVNRKEQILQLEHSLVSLSKWESKWNKPFLSRASKTYEETIDYIRCMTITQNVDPDSYKYLSAENIEQVNAYIEAPMTATTINDSDGSSGTGEQITNELIYYWMIILQIPFECQRWHLNRLLTLIRVCKFKNNPPKKKSTKELISRNAALNAARKKSMNTKG